MNDIELVKRYLRKAQSSGDRGIEFDLPFISFKNLMAAKYCKYTGIRLTDSGGKKPRATDRTIDRIDNRLGYVSGNVAAVCHAANQIKSHWENPNNPITPDLVVRIVEESQPRPMIVEDQIINALYGEAA